MDAIIAGALFEFALRLEKLDSSIDYREAARRFADQRGLSVTKVNTNWASIRKGEGMVEDPTQLDALPTGITVQAINTKGVWEEMDIIRLDRISLIRWMMGSIARHGNL